MSEKEHERDLARGVMYEVERATGYAPRPQKIWVYAALWGVYAVSMLVVAIGAAVWTM